MRGAVSTPARLGRALTPLGDADRLDPFHDVLPRRAEQRARGREKRRLLAHDNLKRLRSFVPPGRTRTRDAGRRLTL
jgi:hypothetical protein